MQENWHWFVVGGAGLIAANFVMLSVAVLPYLGRKQAAVTARNWLGVGAAAGAGYLLGRTRRGLRQPLVQIGAPEPAGGNGYLRRPSPRGRTDKVASGRKRNNRLPHRHSRAVAW